MAGERLLQSSKNFIEGIVAKKISSEYKPGIQSKNCIKIKFEKTTTAYICGEKNDVSDNAPYGSLNWGIMTVQAHYVVLAHPQPVFSKATVQYGSWLTVTFKK